MVVDKQGGAAGVEGGTLSGKEVVLLHGMWMPGAEMLLLKRWLEKGGEFTCHTFSYPSVKSSLQENSRLLYESLRGIDSEELHLVGHSLGGIVALRMLATHSDAPPGRVVCLGSPLCGSRAAGALLSHRWGRSIIGATLGEGAVDEPASTWATEVAASREIGVIAGTVPVGMGRLLVQFDGDNDGTVAVAETRLPGASDHLSMPVNHTGLVTSADVAKQVLAFLRSGRFHRQQ